MEDDQTPAGTGPFEIHPLERATVGGAPVDSSSLDGVPVDGVPVTSAGPQSGGVEGEGGESAGGELEIELLGAIEEELADVERALERLGDGSYGRCETCGQLFGEEELEAAPARRFCRAHLPLDLPR